MLYFAPALCRTCSVLLCLVFGLSALAATTDAWGAPFDDLNIKIEPPREAPDTPPEQPPEEPPEKLEAPSRPELEPEDKPNDALAAAKLAFQQKNFAQCLDLLVVASAQNPSMPPPRLMLADMYLHNNMRQSGRALLERVALEDSSHPELWRLFGALALGEGRWTEAAMHFKRALELPKPNAWRPVQKATFELTARQGLAAAAERRGDWPGAAAAHGQIVSMTPADPTAHDRWASALFRADFTDKALEQFKIAYLLDNSMPQPELSMGIMSINDGNFKQADGWFARAIAAFPENPTLRYQIAVALMVQDRAKEAAINAAKAAELGLDSPELNMVRGYAARQMNAADEAEKFFRAVLEERPDDATAKDQLALVLIETSDEAKQQEALKLAREAADAPDASGGAKATLGWVQYRLGHIAEADALLEKAVQSRGLSPDSLYLIGRFCQEQGHTVELNRVAGMLAASMSRQGVFVARPSARRWLREVASSAESEK